MRLWRQAREDRPPLAEDLPSAGAQALRELALGGRGDLTRIGVGPEAAERTRVALAGPDSGCLVDACFEHAGVRVRVDWVTRREDGLALHRVVDRPRPRDADADPLVLACWCARQQGFEVVAAELWYADPDREWDGRPDSRAELLARRDVGSDVRLLAEDAGDEIEAQRAVLAADAAPEVEPGPHCLRPRCPHHAECTADRSADWLGFLPALRERHFAAWRARGIGSMAELEPADLRRAAQRNAARAAREQGRVLEPSVAARLAELVAASASALDFEAGARALPLWPGTRPWEPIPYVFAHARPDDPDGRFSHVGDPRDDPRRPFAAALVEHFAGDRGPVLVYSGFEAEVLARLAALLPDLADALLALRERLVDLLPLFRDGVYDPRFRGAFSLKRVVPALVADFDWSDLAGVADGGAAAAAFDTLRETDLPASERRALERQLADYCERDAEALLRLVDPASWRR